MNYFIKNRRIEFAPQKVQSVELRMSFDVHEHFYDFCFNKTVFAFIGYMLNVVTGDHYKFVSWGIGRGSYLVSLTLMFLFVRMRWPCVFIPRKSICVNFSVYLRVICLPNAFISTGFFKF